LFCFSPARRRRPRVDDGNKFADWPNQRDRHLQETPPRDTSKRHLQETPPIVLATEATPPGEPCQFPSGGPRDRPRSPASQAPGHDSLVGLVSPFPAATCWVGTESIAKFKVNSMAPPLGQPNLLKRSTSGSPRPGSAIPPQTPMLPDSGTECRPWVSPPAAPIFVL